MADAVTDQREMICIACPVGCQLRLTVDGDELKKVENNLCKRGISYATDEFYDPRRILTTTVHVEGGTVGELPVRTKDPIKKGLIMKGMRELRDLVVKAPISMGDPVLHDIAGSGVDLIASRSVRQREG